MQSEFRDRISFRGDEAESPMFVERDGWFLFTNLKYVLRIHFAGWFALETAPALPVDEFREHSDGPYKCSDKKIFQREAVVVSCW